MNKVIYRSFKKQDSDDIANIIKLTWGYQQFTSEKMAKRLSKIFLFSCLNNQTFTKVATVDDKVVGIIMGRDHHQKVFKPYYLFKQWTNIIPLLMHKEGRQIAKFFRLIYNIDQELLANTNFHYQGELVFFAVNSQYRNLGIGKQLFTSFQDYCQQQNIETYYLFTDTSCNFSFYANNGLKRQGEIDKTFTIDNHPVTMQFYLYDKR